MRTARPTWAVALPVAAAGTAALLGAASPAPDSWLRLACLVAVGGELSRSHALLTGLALLMLARGLLLHRLLAQRIIAALALLSLFAIVERTEPAWRLAVVAALLVALIRTRDWFDVLPSPPRVRSAARAAATVLVAASVYGTGALLLQRNHLIPGLEPANLGRELVGGLTANPGPLSVSGSAQGWLVPALSVLGGLGLLLALALLLAPAPAPPPGSPAERTRVRLLTDHPASDPLAPFALRRDKSYLFSPDGRAALGYRVLLGTAVVGADPVGEPAAFPALVHLFLDRCHAAGWRPAVIGARDELAALWREHGLRTIYIGDETVFPVATFTLTTRRLRNVRQAVSRTHNCGVRTEIHREADVPPVLRAELLAIATRWRAGVAERGFSMNLDGLLDGTHPDCRLVVARDHDGRPVAFQRYAVCRGGRVLSLDAMPREPDAPNGVNERMIVDLVTWARNQCAEEVSLNFAAFRTLVEAGTDRNLGQRAGYRLMHQLDRFIRVESLYLFNAKFRPCWLARHVVFGSWAQLGWVGFAALGLEFALPYDRTRRLPPAPAPAPAHVAVPGREAAG